MLKLMKYEFRKSMFSKLVLLVALGISELLFLYGLYFKDPEKSPIMAIGIAALVIVVIIGISFLGIESILGLHRDLNTKQSYMLFMTPRNGYQILGAKILESALSITAASIFFLFLAGIDIGMLLAKLGGIKAIFELMQNFLQINIDWELVREAVVTVFLEGTISWFSMVVTGYLAVVLTASVLAGKKLSGLIAFFVYLVLTFIQGRVLALVMKQFAVDTSYAQELILYGVTTLVFSILIYLCSCFLIQKKLSV